VDALAGYNTSQGGVLDLKGEKTCSREMRRAERGGNSQLAIRRSEGGSSHRRQLHEYVQRSGGVGLAPQNNKSRGSGEKWGWGDTHHDIAFLRERSVKREKRSNETSVAAWWGKGAMCGGGVRVAVIGRRNQAGQAGKPARLQ